MWPHDNAICAAGLMRYGFVDEAHRVMRGLVDASPWFGDLLPELFSGIDRDDAQLPGELPDVVLAAGVGRGVAVAVPAHAAALRARHPQPKLHLAPAVPDWIGTLRLDNIPIMGGQLGGRGRRARSCSALQVPDGLTIVSDPRRRRR